ncbi:MAG TPA: hypothetical protein VFP72_06015, partial [Kineosporiaceae bacterium]|nr:hypothetical protein [Kineosporiaceae bacterium]
MGAFSEVVLSFSFRPDTPDHVLAAFSALKVPPGDGWYSAPAPPLPPPQHVEDDDWEPTNELHDPAEDPEPWRHDWAGWVSNSMSVATTAHAQLAWSAAGRWVLSCRWVIKSWPDAIV